MRLSEDVTPQDALEIRRRLIEFNAQAVPIDSPNPQPLKIAVRDSEGLLKGGIIASLQWSILYVDLLWLDADYRHMGYGSQLIQEAERLARQQGCHAVQLDTFDFQAPDFYKREGYDCFAILEDFPLGYKRYYYKKVLL